MMKKMQTHRWIWQAARGEAGVILLQTVISAVVSLSFVFFAIVSRRVIDMATGAMPGNMWMQNALLIGILAAQALLHIINNLLQARTVGRLEMRMRERVFSALFRKKWQEVSAHSSGDVLNRLTGDVTVTVNGMTSLIPQAVSLLTRLAASLTVLLMMDKLFCGIVLAVGLTVLAAARLYGKSMKKLHRAFQETEGDSRFFMQECVENWTVVQSFGVLDWVRRRLADLQKKNFRLRMLRARIGSVAGTVVYLLFSGCYYIALAWGAWRLATGVITFGTLTAFLQIVQQVQTPFRSMSGVLPQYYNMLASAERLMELENLPDEPPALPLPRDTAFSELTVSNLTFLYDREPIFNGATLTVHRGEFVAIAGYSGVGKSTFFKLLLGFLEPQDGHILCRTTAGDLPVGTATRSLFSYVPQGNLLLSGTIRQNLTFCCETATEEEIWNAAAAADIADFIRQLPEGLDTVLGERGLGLSEGQLQRLAIARGVLHGAPILLLDEATSALDEATERRVLAALHALPDKTCICITHRTAALEICDTVVHIRDGKFEEVPLEKTENA